MAGSKSLKENSVFSIWPYSLRSYCLELKIEPSLGGVIVGVFIFLQELNIQHTKIPKRKLNEMLKRDLWFDAETCLDYGLVDEIIG